MKVTKLHVLLLLALSLVHAGQVKWWPNRMGSSPEIPRIIPYASIEQSIPTFHDGFTVDYKGQLLHLNMNQSALVVIKAKSQMTVIVKFIDDTYIIEKNDVDNNIIIPFLQPIDWMHLSEPDSAKVCVFGLNQKKMRNSNQDSKKIKCTYKVSGSDAKVIMPRKLGHFTHEYFLSAQYIPDPEDVSITIGATIDQFESVLTLASVYKGPISCALFATSQKDVNALMATYLSDRNARMYIDIHLVFEDSKSTLSGIPVNHLRNVGIRYVRTSSIISLDPGFYPTAPMKVIKTLIETDDNKLIALGVYDAPKLDLSKFPISPGSFSDYTKTDHPLFKQYPYENSITEDKGEFYSPFVGTRDTLEYHELLSPDDGFKLRFENDKKINQLRFASKVAIIRNMSAIRAQDVSFAKSFTFEDAVAIQEKKRKQSGRVTWWDEAFFKPHFPEKQQEQEVENKQKTLEIKSKIESELKETNAKIDSIQQEISLQQHNLTYLVIQSLILPLVMSSVMCCFFSWKGGRKNASSLRRNRSW